MTSFELGRRFDDMFARLPAFLDQVETAVSRWTAQEFTGTADEDRITATVDAMGSLRGLEVSVLSKRRLDNISLGEAIVAAVHAAEAAAERAKADMLAGLRFGDRSMGDLLAEGSRSIQDWTR